MDRFYPIYRFLFYKHRTGFFRFCMLALIPCALSEKFCRIWMYALCLLQVIMLYADINGWDSEEN